MPSAKVRKSRHCLICRSGDLTLFLALGQMPLANSYVSKDALNKPELKVPLDVYYCHKCHLVQLLDIVDRGLLFNNYAYFSSASSQLVEHFEEYAADIMNKFPKQAKQLTIDVGSNDGVLLKPLKKLGARVLGIDPAKNITNIKGLAPLETITDFFSSRIGPKIRQSFGQAGIITANNVLAHTDELHDIIATKKQLLSDDGVFVFEVQYLPDLLKQNEFDSIYHEHICYYSLHPLIYLLEQYDLKVFDVKHVDNHGGSLRIYACHKNGPFSVRKSVETLLARERTLNLSSVTTYTKFAKQPLVVKNKLTGILADIKNMGKRVTGYGAPAKATTLLNYSGITAKDLDYITDTTPSKQYLFMPGNHIPILPPETIKKDTPDYILILSWNYAKLIQRNERWFKKQGGKFILPIPYPKVID